MNETIIKIIAAAIGAAAMAVCYAVDADLGREVKSICGTVREI